MVPFNCVSHQERKSILHYIRIWLLVMTHKGTRESKKRYSVFSRCLDICLYVTSGKAADISAAS